MIQDLITTHFMRSTVPISISDFAFGSSKEGQLPVLGCEISEFLLYCPIVGSEELCLEFVAALGPWDTIGSVEGRNFLLCKKTEAEHGRPQISPRERANLKAWFHKSSIHTDK
ncbi:hypothetical protein K1719_002761 [Acacia pycnantha]|nr:hypothetical protein K1719_002761 [Acacia pycnantha]